MKTCKTCGCDFQPPTGINKTDARNYRCQSCANAYLREARERFLNRREPSYKVSIIGTDPTAPAELRDDVRRFYYGTWLPRAAFDDCVSQRMLDGALVQTPTGKYYVRNSELVDAKE